MPEHRGKMAAAALQKAREELGKLEAVPAKQRKGHLRRTTELNEAFAEKEALVLEQIAAKRLAACELQALKDSVTAELAARPRMEVLPDGRIAAASSGQGQGGGSRWARPVFNSNPSCGTLASPRVRWCGIWRRCGEPRGPTAGAASPSGASRRSA